MLGAKRRRAMIELKVPAKMTSDPLSRHPRYHNGPFQSATVYRVNDPTRPGFKQLLCGLCVAETAASDPLKISGTFCCEECGAPVGKPSAFERADELLARICSVAARHRRERLSGVAEALPATPLLLDRSVLGMPAT